MNALKQTINQNITIVAVLIKNEFHELHSAVAQIERKFEQRSTTQFVGSVFIKSIKFQDVDYKRTNVEFISDGGCKITLESKL